MVLDQQKENQRREQLFNNYLMSGPLAEARLSRLKINDAGDRKLEARVMIHQLCTREDNPAEGCIFFIENFGWTIDPRRTPKHIPFFLFDYQKEAIRYVIDHIDGEKDMLLEKSRDMGVTWLLVWIFLWYWLFRDGANLLMGSYKERLVDDRSIDSLFGKIDYSLQSLPVWLLPRRFNANKHRTKLRLVNPVNNNLLSGDTMNPDFGRGSRKTAIFYDELGFWDYAKESWESGGDSTPCRIANSTPHGFNYYAQLRNSGIDVLTLHWTLHPLKDDQWYEFEKNRRTEEEVAQELDISYSKSQEGRVYPEWSENNIEFGEWEYDPGLPLYVGWDYGKEDPTAIIWAQPFDGKLRIVDSYTNNGKLIDFYIPFITGFVPSDNYQYTLKDLDIIEKHKNWKRGIHFGDPAGRFANQVSDHTVFSRLRDANIIVNYNDSWKTHQNRKRAAKQIIMDGIQIHRNDRTEYFSLCMEQSTYPKVLREGMKEVRSDKPLHNYTSHYRSAFEYMALGIGEFTHRSSRPRDMFERKPEYDGGRRRALRY